MRAAPPTSPGETFTAVMPAQSHDCGLRADGALTCWGTGAPVAGTVRGPFAQLAGDEWTMCAVAATNRALTCWGTGAGVNRGFERAAGPVARVAVDNRGVCALRVSGELVCWGHYLPQPASVAGRFKAFDMHNGYACGVEANAGTITCWYRESMAPNQRGRRLQPVGGGGYIDVAVGWERGCGLDGGGGVHCWPANMRATFAGARFRAVSGGGLICGVTVEGRVVCEDREYY